MVSVGEVLRLPTSTLHVLATAEETGGARFEVRVTYDPGSPAPPLHLHPHQTEVFAVEEGELVFTVAGEERPVTAGTSITLPAGNVHTVRNASKDRVAVATWTTQPALRTGEFFARLVAAAGETAAVVDVLGDHRREIRFPEWSDD